MSKKKFTAGMDSLFGGLEDQHKEQESVSGKETKRSDKTSKAKKDEARKGFKDDLHAFLREAFEESLEEKLKEPAPAKTTGKSKAGKPMGGLDALLRSTIEPSKMKLQNKPVRRLTLSFDQQKLEKLKHIARLEKTYLKDIIDEIVEEFIEEYESSNGPIRKPR